MASPLYGPHTLDAIADQVVGRRREAELVTAALMGGRHLLLEGPPGTGKSTILRAVATSGSQGFSFVEGNAELTPARLTGHFDPAQVLDAGYIDDIWVDGPLLEAMRHGGLLYLEEINRVPEETLNLLVTVMSEAELTVPRLGTVSAHPDFRLVAAMNPFDAVGTARISGAIYDRVCRVAMDYQTAEDESAIVASAVSASDTDTLYRQRVVEVVRATRDHPETMVGSSVRGAVDLLLLARDLATLRGTDATNLDVGLDAALTALSGRIRLADSSTSTADEVITELWWRFMKTDAEDQPADQEPGDDSAGKGRGRQGAAPATKTETTNGF